MSAYIVDHDSINYLVQSGLDIALRDLSPNFSFYNIRDSERHELHSGNADEIGSMLLEENVLSVSYRYPGDSLEDLPGFEGLAYNHMFHGYNFDAINILAVTDCYEYQSCEHPGWHTSTAKAYIDALRQRTWRQLPGYANASHRAPKPVGVHMLSLGKR